MLAVRTLIVSTAIFLRFDVLNKTNYEKVIAFNFHFYDCNHPHSLRGWLQENIIAEIGTHFQNKESLA